MAKLFEEMGEFLSRGEETEYNRRSIFQRQQRAEVGKVMSELIADPRWELYVRHIEENRRRAEALVNRFTAEMLNGPCVSHETYAQQKVELAGAKAQVEAFTIAIDLVQTLIGSGNEATRDLSEVEQRSRG